MARSGGITVGIISRLLEQRRFRREALIEKVDHLAREIALSCTQDFDDIDGKFGVVIGTISVNDYVEQDSVLVTYEGAIYIRTGETLYRRLNLRRQKMRVLYELHSQMIEYVSPSRERPTS